MAGWGAESRCAWYEDGKDEVRAHILAHLEAKG
jgi:hypothetical protein